MSQNMLKKITIFVIILTGLMWSNYPQTAEARTVAPVSFFVHHLNTCKMDNIKCTSCKEIKSLNEFYKSNNSSNGLQNECIKCTKFRLKEKNHTIEGFINRVYADQKKSSYKRNHGSLDYSKEELKQWLISHNDFTKLFHKWVDSNYKKDLKPSIDRLNDYKGYSFDNIRLVTWKENRMKYASDSKKGYNNKQSKSIIQMTSEGSFIKEHYSIRSAERITGVDHNCITNCCKLKQKTAGKYTWRYL